MPQLARQPHCWFIELFGEFITLTNIATQGKADWWLQGPLGGLVATAIGLLPPIPAVLAYNAFVRLIAFWCKILRMLPSR